MAATDKSDYAKSLESELKLKRQAKKVSGEKNKQRSSIEQVCHEAVEEIRVMHGISRKSLIDALKIADKISELEEEAAASVGIENTDASIKPTSDIQEHKAVVTTGVRTSDTTSQQVEAGNKVTANTEQPEEPHIDESNTNIVTNQINEGIETLNTQEPHPE